MNRQNLDAPKSANFLTPRRTRAVVEAVALLHENADDQSRALDLVLGIRWQGWNMATFQRHRSALARRLADRRWSPNDISETMRSDRRTVRKWLGLGVEE